MTRKRWCVLALAASLLLSLLPGFAPFSAAAEYRHAGYDFDDTANITADAGGNYPLSTALFGRNPSSVNGYRGSGICGYIAFDPVLFSGFNEFSVGFWMKFSAEEASHASILFSAVGKAGESVELAFSPSAGRTVLQLRLFDGSNTVTCSADCADAFGEEAAWNHVAFTYKKAGGVSLATLYVNGVSKDFSQLFVDLSAMECRAAYLTEFSVDEVYVANRALTPAKIESMMKLSMANFYAAQQLEEGGSSGTSGQDDPPVLDAYAYSWAAYLFEDSFAGATDLHENDNPCTVDYTGCIGIKTANLKEKFGYALIRRDGAAPRQYLSLPVRLFRDQSAFSFACWIYRSGKTKPCGECLLALDGIGVLRFAPYSVEDNGTASAYIEYTDDSGAVLHRSIGSGQPADPLGEWVHYALTVDAAGTISVYVNGVLAATYASALSPAKMAISAVDVITGSAAADPTRTAIDEVYVAPRALSASDVRKIRFYGLQRFTSEVLPDPNTSDNPSTDVPDPYAPDAVDVEQDAYTQTAVIAGGFIGTTFDSRVEPGADWNNGAKASLTGGQLTKGVASYALLLDGSSSFLRYPAGILNGVSSLTIGISYQWSGLTSASSRAQRLFDFSRKTSSVAEPEAFLFLEMGTGFSGLRFGIGDGVRTTYLNCDYNETGVWTRVTVTVERGKITIYLNDTVAATGLTDVDLASVCPNFCYIGKSGVKGDPLFKGIVDEIYISSSALSADRVGDFKDGIASAVSGASVAEKDVWGTVIIIIIVSAAVLVFGVVALIVVIMTRKDKQRAPVRPADPAPPVQTGPRTARRLRQAAELIPDVDDRSAASEGETAAFRPVRPPKDS